VLPRSVAIAALDQNRGYAAAVNAAHALARRAGSAAVLVLNNDIVVDPSCLDALVAARDAVAEPVAAVSAVTLSADEETVLCGGVDVLVTLGRARHLFIGARIDELPERPYDVDAVEGSCVLLDVASFEDIGGFDESFFMYWEDTEWSVRARRAGFRLLVAPAARARHDVGASTRPIARVELLIKNRIRFVRRTADWPAQLVFAMYFLGFWVPAYLPLKLAPSFGWRASMGILARSVRCNVREIFAVEANKGGPRLPTEYREMPESWSR